MHTAVLHDLLKKRHHARLLKTLDFHIARIFILIAETSVNVLFRVTEGYLLHTIYTHEVLDAL